MWDFFKKRLKQKSYSKEKIFAFVTLKLFMWNYNCILF